MATVASFSAGTFGANPSGTSAFGSSSGAFGQQTQQATNSFGATQQPSTSAFGTFGSTPTSNAFGSTSTGFGASRPTLGSTGAFGTGTSAFGSGTSAFGQQQTQSAFGAPAAPPVPVTGTSNPPFSVVSHADNDATPNVKSNFMSISCMEPYKNASFEELRLADYQQNRKTSTGTGSGAGFGTNASGPFGSGTSSFGTGTGAFGQGATTFGQAPSTGVFGQQTNTNTSFGQPGGTFGQPAAGTFGATSTGAFGQQTPATGAFGQTTGGLFGQTQPNASGAFGSSTSAFGAKPNPFGTSTGSGFGTGTATSTGFGTNTSGPFGTPATSTSGFGTSQPATTGGLFGSQPAAGSAFGTGTNAFGAKPSPFGATTSTFGQPTTTAPASNPFGGFGQQQQQQPATATALGGATGGLFGQQQQPGQQTNQVQQQPSAGGLFGTASTSGFGTGTSTFGSGGGFGSSTGGLFGSKPAGTAFGQPQPVGGNLFGNPNPQQPAISGLGASTFGQPNQASNGFGAFGSGSIFGNNPIQQQQQQQQIQQPQPILQASIDQNAYGNNPIFANLGTLTPSASLAASTKKKAPPISDVRSTSSPRPPGTASKINKLRGFSNSGAGSASASPLKGNSLSASASHSHLDTSKNSVFTTLGTTSEDTILSPNAFVSRPSAKKLLIKPGAAKEASLRERSVTIASLSPPPKSHAPKNGQLVFDPDAVTLANDTFVGRGLPGAITSTPARPTPKDREVFASSPPPRGQIQPLPSSNEPSDSTKLLTESTAQDGDYWMSPSLDVLQRMSRDQLKAVHGFTVGRKGFGKVRFQVPVDLTTVTSFRAILENYIIFEPQQCTVYPDDMDNKPPRGQGLNVPGVITLEGCYPLTKDTRSPIKSADDIRVKQYVNKLKKTPGTTFISYDATTGEWAFRVEHW